MSTCSAQFQSTHPHGVRQGPDGHRLSRIHVSIHAPTRGATHGGHRRELQLQVSIHAPTRGATVTRFFEALEYLFQSTHPHGVRPQRGRVARGSKRFQSTHPHGVRQRRRGRLSLDIWFQSTHPHGVRPTTSRVFSGSWSFQSTHPHGVRPNDDYQEIRRLTFQSTHPHGVRLYILQILDIQQSHYRYLRNTNNIRIINRN